jgi:hypothetical protein
LRSRWAVYVIVTYMSTARQRLGEHIAARANVHNNRTCIARRRLSKQTFSTLERLCFVRGLCEVVVKPSFETPACQDMSFGAEELTREWSDPTYRNLP